MVVGIEEQAHPIVGAAHAIRETLASVADVEPMFMTPLAQAEALRELVAAESQLVELRARVIGAAAQVADQAGRHDTAGWLAHATHLGAREARAQQRLAGSLSSWPQVAAGMRAGAVTREQADVLTHALAGLPDDTDHDTLDRAEAHLVDLCEKFNPAQLMVLGRKVLDVLDPTGAEQREAEKLAQEERSALEKTRLTLRPQHDGTTTLTGRVPDLAATRLAHLLQAFTSPRHRHETNDTTPSGAASSGEAGSDQPVWWRLPGPRKLGEAFCELLERIDPALLPQHGTTGTEIIVTLSLDALRTDLAAATVIGPHGPERITASQARRLACEAGIIPAVLNSKGQPLDLGRAQRLATKAQKKALMLAHATCQAVGCETPASWTEAHHLDPWCHGGRTDLHRMVLLCRPDHQRIHDSSYLHEQLPDGTIRFTRRT